MLLFLRQVVLRRFLRTRLPARSNRATQFQRKPGTHRADCYRSGVDHSGRRFERDHRLPERAAPAARSATLRAALRPADLTSHSSRTQCVPRRRPR